MLSSLYIQLHPTSKQTCSKKTGELDSFFDKEQMGSHSNPLLEIVLEENHSKQPCLI